MMGCANPQRSTFRASMILLCLAVVGTSPLRAEEDFAAELPRIPVTEPSETLPSFTVAEGFRIEQVACEPLVTSPVAMEWDADGRLYVCEMRGYSEDQELGISRITRLEDKDDDGVFDTSVVFADGLMWPTALFPVRWRSLCRRCPGYLLLQRQRR